MCQNSRLIPAPPPPAARSDTRVCRAGLRVTRAGPRPPPLSSRGPEPLQPERAGTPRAAGRAPWAWRVCSQQPHTAVSSVASQPRVTGVIRGASCSLQAGSPGHAGEVDARGLRWPQQCSCCVREVGRWPVAERGSLCAQGSGKSWPRSPSLRHTWGGARAIGAVRLPGSAQLGCRMGQLTPVPSPARGQ